MFDFLGTEPDGQPFAELWFGAHPLAPATVDERAATKKLNEVIDLNRTAHLGERVDTRFGRLPYLVKLLAPARPLSIQVHPNPLLASEGFRRETELGIPLADFQRSFKDEYHKPEMVYAITRFEGLAGFRPVEEMALLLNAIGEPLAAACSAIAAAATPAASARAALEHILALDPESIEQTTEKCRILADSSDQPVLRDACATVLELSHIYPGDVGIVVSVLLNRFRLERGQLLFIADGVPHAYLSGFGLEVMANSDNVLRLGLTRKHIDVPATLGALDFTAFGYKIETSPEAVTHTFRPDAEEFALSIIRPGLSPEPRTEFSGGGPRILVCLEGSVSISQKSDVVELTQGESSYGTATDGPVFVSGEGVLAAIFVP
uniref:mannose-6-phosphate isomerase, class I n=1 Tax=Paenarthrobacter ureafaciens TaxID=37931 RepID=UPI000AC103D2